MSQTPVEGHSLTIEEYAGLPEPPGFRTELVKGRVVRRPLLGTRAGRTKVRLMAELDAFVEDQDLGVVMGTVGLVLDPGVATVRGPDLLFLSHERLPSPLPEGFLEVAPDLVVEIISPNDTATEITEKVLEYLDGGCRLVWVVDPSNKCLTIYPFRNGIRILVEGEMMDGGDVLPGLRIRLSDVLPGR